MIINDVSFKTFLIDSCVFRKGLLLTLTSSNGDKATTEISPLPGYSDETLDEVKNQLEQIKRRITGKWWSKQALHSLRNMGLYPSVHFGIESALIDLLDPISESDDVKMYSLLFGSPDEILKRAEDVYQEGNLHAKLKLGHFSPSVAHELIEKLGSTFKLRLDFNRKWSSKESIKFCSHYPDDFFEYLEEPCKDSDDLINFPYPYALDETLRMERSIKRFLESKNLKALILKPTMLYPFTDYLKLGVKCVLTSSFESKVGIEQIKRLIRRLGLEEIFHGLDTLRYFEGAHEMPNRLVSLAKP